VFTTGHSLPLCLICVLTRKISVNPGQIGLLVDGPSGPDYTLLSSTNLLDWESISTVASPTPPVTLSDTNPPAAPARFYRIQLGP
jgi:hypothetical protein